MTDPNPDILYNVVCAGCMQFLGRVYAHHADHLQDVHAPHCKASEEQWEQAAHDIVFAHITGDTSAITTRLGQVG